MRVTRLFNQAAASTSAESPTLTVLDSAPLKDSVSIFVQLTENPAADGVNLRFRGRADPSGEWFTIATYNAGTAWHVPTGTIRTFGERFDQGLRPQLSFELIAVSLSANLVSAYVFGY